MSNLLVVEDDETERKRIVELIGSGDDVEITAVGSSEEALRRSSDGRFDCMVLDLKLPDMAGLQPARGDQEGRRAPGPAGDRPHGQGAHAPRGDASCASTRRPIIVKDVSLARAPARRDVRCSCTGSRRGCRPTSARCSSSCTTPTWCSQGKKVLVVDDDVRNVFALASAPSRRAGMEVLFAENGRDGVDTLKRQPGRRPRADGHHDARDGRLRGHARRSASIPSSSSSCRSSP